MSRMLNVLSKWPMVAVFVLPPYLCTVLQLLSKWLNNGSLTVLRYIWCVSQELSFKLCSKLTYALFLCTDSTSTSPSSQDLPYHDDIDRVRLQHALTPYNRQDYLVPASPAGACDIMTYWDNCRQQVPFFDHLLPVLLRRVATTALSVDGGTWSLVDGGDVAGGGDLFACSDCTKRYSSASNLARHRVTHQRPTTTTVTTATTDRRVTRQCPHCAKVSQSQSASMLVSFVALSRLFTADKQMSCNTRMPLVQITASFFNCFGSGRPYKHFLTKPRTPKEEEETEACRCSVSRPTTPPSSWFRSC